MKELVKIVIPTYKRAGKVTTHKVVANCSLVVREEEYEAYRKAYPDMEIFKIPKGEIQNGIADTREWIMRNVNNGNVFMLDDDVTTFVRAYNPGQYDELMFTNPDVIHESHVDPQTIYDVIQADAHLAKQMGCYLFGFTVASNPRDCPPQLPYRVNGMISGGAFGVLRGEPGCKIEIPYHEPGVALCEDYYVMLINAYYHRFCLINYRFCEMSTTFRNVGGLSEYRSTEGEKEAYLYLKRKFGSAVRRKGQGYTNEGKPRKASSPYERVLNLPF
nr:MAG TPA: hypothetical protein [Caudoviricetes sp.]